MEPSSVYSLALGEWDGEAGGAFPFTATPDKLVREGFLPIGPRTERAPAHCFSTSAAALSLANVFVSSGLSTNVLDPAVSALSRWPRTLRCSNSQKVLRKSMLLVSFLTKLSFLWPELLESWSPLRAVYCAGKGRGSVTRGGARSPRGGARSPRGGVHSKSTFVTRLSILHWEPHLKAFCNFFPSLLLSKPSSLS